jgi:hypothetical protein
VPATGATLLTKNSDASQTKDLNYLLAMMLLKIII